MYYYERSDRNPRNAGLSIFLYSLVKQIGVPPARLMVFSKSDVLQTPLLKPSLNELCQADSMFTERLSGADQKGRNIKLYCMFRSKPEFVVDRIAVIEFDLL